uniref:Uncharacterized protein n=1 Tax=Anopheles stephensi TaxID=30069 RepID=A0A182YPK3_ANOST
MPNLTSRCLNSLNLHATDWMTGCDRERKLYCWPCLLFNTSEYDVWGKRGFSDFGRLATARAEHTKNSSHHAKSKTLKLWIETASELSESSGEEDVECIPELDFLNMSASELDEEIDVKPNVEALNASIAFSQGFGVAPVVNLCEVAKDDEVTAYEPLPIVVDCEADSGNAEPDGQADSGQTSNVSSGTVERRGSISCADDYARIYKKGQADTAGDTIMSHTVQSGAEKYQLKWHSHYQNMNVSLSNLYKNDRYADVMLLTCNGDDNYTIPAHKLILGTSSLYFANIFDKNPVPLNAVTYIVLPPDLTYRSMQILIQYMYTGESTVSTDILSEVLRGGEILKIRGLWRNDGTKPPGNDVQHNAGGSSSNSKDQHAPIDGCSGRETFTIPGDWVRHIEGHSDTSQTLPKRRRRAEESETADETAALRCDLCATFYVTPADWVRHVQNAHTESELAACNKRANRRTSRSRLTSTTQQSAGNAPTAPAASPVSATADGAQSEKHCNVCNKSFPSYASMAIHRRTHTGEKPFYCEICNKGFTVKSNLIRHMRSLHNQPGSPHSDQDSENSSDPKMSKSYEPQIKWRADEVDELVASMKERDLLAQSDGKKRRSLEVFAVVRSDLMRKGIFRTEEQIRKKMNELRKQYFEANRSGSENRYELCEHYDALHDLFTDAQRKLDKRTERSRAGRSKRRHSSQNGGQDVPHSVQVNLSKQNRGRSVSGSSVCSSAPSVHHNGGGEQNQQQHSQQNGGESVPTGARRSNASPAQPTLPDKFHLKQCAYQPNLNNSLANLCKNDRYADVMLLVCNDHDSIAIPAHRLVLGTFSPYFANVFEKFTFASSTPIIYVALPPNVTRAAIQCLLQYMYTGEAIVHSKSLDDVMACGEFLRISGFSAKKASSMLRNRQGLVSVPLVTVTKTINMDASLQSDARHGESATPAPASTSTARVSAPSTPVPMTVRPYYDSQSPPRKMARHYEPLEQQQQQQQQPVFQQPMQMQPLRHSLQRTMYQDELLEQQLMQQQRTQMRQYAPQRQQLQQYQQQDMADDFYQPLQPPMRQPQRLMMQQPLQQQPTLLQQRYHTQQLPPLDMDMEQDLLPVQPLQMPRQQRQQQQMMPTQQQQESPMYQPQSVPLSRQQLLQTQARIRQQNMALLQQPQQQMVQNSLFLQQQRQQMQSQQLQDAQDELQLPEQLLVQLQQLLEPPQQPAAAPRQQQLQPLPSTSQQQSQQPLQLRAQQQQSQRDETLVQRPEQQLLASQELLEPRRPSLPKPQDDLIQPSELLDESQELLELQKKVRSTVQQPVQQRPSVQQKLQTELIKPQEQLDESQELLEPQKPRQPEQKIQRPNQEQLEQPKQPQRPLKQQKTQLKPDSNNVAHVTKEAIAAPKENPDPVLEKASNDAAAAATASDNAPEETAETSKGNDSIDKSLDDSAHTRSDSEIEFLEKPRKNTIFEEFPDHRKLKLIEDHEQRKKDIIKEYEEQLKKPSPATAAAAATAAPAHPLVETPESSPSVAPVSPKSPVVAHRYASKSPLPATVTALRHRKPCPQRQPTPPSPGPDIIDTLDSMVVLTSDESMMEIIAKSPESQTSHFSTRSQSPESQANIDALIEHMRMPDTDAAIFVNSSMEEQSCDELDDDSNDHQEGTPLDHLVSSRLNCQLCYESFTTPPEWVQHVSGHCVADMGLLKRRRISNDDDSDFFRCDMCSSYFISAQDWQNHVANHEDHDDV